MSSRAEILLKDLSENLDLPDLKFDDQNMCTLLIDNVHRVTILANSDSQLILYGIIGGVSDNINKNFALDLLTANMLLAEVYGPHLGYEPISKSILLIKAVSFENLNIDKLENEIDLIVNHQINITNFLKDKGIVLQDID